MKKHSKVGGKPGRPAYRTPSTFRFQKAEKSAKIKSLSKKISKRVCGK